MNGVSLVVTGHVNEAEALVAWTGQDESDGDSADNNTNADAAVLGGEERFAALPTVEDLYWFVEVRGALDISGLMDAIPGVECNDLSAKAHAYARHSPDEGFKFDNATVSFSFAIDVGGEEEEGSR